MRDGAGLIARQQAIFPIGISLDTDKAKLHKFI